LFCFGDFGAWGEGAEFGVDGDLFYSLSFWFVFGSGL
jgi:hypothetical protein